MAAAIPQHPQACIPPHETQSFWNGARFPYRSRRRVTLWYLAAAVALSILLYYSYLLLGEKYPHPSPRPQVCQSLDPHMPCQPELQVDSPRPTVTITQTAPSTTETVVIAPPVEPVVFSLIMISESAADEGTFLLKVSYWTFLVRNIAASCKKSLFQSAIMYTSRPLHFHIICDEAAQAYLEARFHLLTHPLHSISVRFYRLSFQSMLDRVIREGSIQTVHSAGIRKLTSLCFSTEHAANTGKLNDRSSWPHEVIHARTVA